MYTTAPFQPVGRTTINGWKFSLRKILHCWVTCIGCIKNRLPKQLLYSQLCLRIRSQGRPRLKLKNDAKRNMKWRDIELNRWLEMREGECQQQTYQEKTYQTVLNPRTVSVEPTDCNDDEWNSFRKKSCCVLRNELIAKSFISSSHGSVREAVKEIQDIKACRAWVYFMG